MKFLFKLYNYYLSPEKAFARRLYSLLGFVPANMAVFRLAFHHKSTVNDKNISSQSNERLEYLGDAVLGMVIAEYLFNKYPFKDEGFLTEVRSRIVNREHLNQLAKKIGLKK